MKKRMPPTHRELHCCCLKKHDKHVWDGHAIDSESIKRPSK